VKYNQLFEKFKGKRVLVIGDVMLDSYILGTVTRISPEAPVPIISLEKKDNRIGGAGNVALNLKHLGAFPLIASVIGNDAEGQLLKTLFDKREISTQGLLMSSERKTTVKTRVISSKQQLLRIDSEDTHPLTENNESAFLAIIEQLLSKDVDAIIIEDYDKGVLNQQNIQQIITLSNQLNIPVTADPKKENFHHYSGLTLFKPNLKELKEGLNIKFNFEQEKENFELGVKQLRNKIPHSISLVTLSEHGVFICDENESKYILAHKREITDVSGAGDTVIAVATLCLLAKASLNDIAMISNIAGGMVCEKPGVVSITFDALKNEVNELL
jgi:rfaE bifunctional protein kinase chain/domain|tara:strand:+ start:3518 stop:4501 length:984 start_codon:yes stop_codon:yes gene_type:complete